MLGFDDFKNARWQDIYAFFVAGDPPLIVILLIINTLFLVFFIFRKTRNGKRSHKASYVMQAILIIANGFVMFQSELLPQGSFLNKLNFSKEIAHKIYEGFTT